MKTCLLLNGSFLTIVKKVHNVEFCDCPHYRSSWICRLLGAHGKGRKARGKKFVVCLLTVYFGTPNMFITLWFGFDYGTNLPLGTLII
jgi:hypothetical protein